MDVRRVAYMAAEADARGEYGVADSMDAAMSREAQWGGYGYGYGYPMIMPSYRQMKMDRDEYARDREEQKMLRQVDPNVTLWDRFQGMLSPSDYNRRTRRELQEKGILPGMNIDQTPFGTRPSNQDVGYTPGYGPNPGFPQGVRPGPGGRRMGTCPNCGSQKLFGVPPIACPNCGQGGPKPGMQY